MGMAPSKLETTLAVEFLEKRPTSGYLMNIVKVLESVFELGNANVTLEVLTDGHVG
jgi:hypothetical protein